MCCQIEDSKEKLIYVTTFKKSQEILEAAKYDHNLCIRMAGVSDLIASEGKYHLKCYIKLQRKTKMISLDSSTIETDMAMIWLVEELKNSSEHGHVSELAEVWNRYCILTNEAGTTVPRSFLSRLATFKGKLLPHVQGFYDFTVLDNKALIQGTVLVPIKFNHVPVATFLESTEDYSTTIPVYKPKEEDEFLSMVHVGLKLRSDMVAHPGHKGLNISKDDAIACVPDSVYMFLRLLLGGQAVLEFDDDDNDEDEDGDEQITWNCNDRWG